ncbi:hypothetical protein [Actinokineospora sp. HUAS TT18]|uniref:hypothetical protein n=1 Tax=Actinokineospora sp. HUAS TT18 TaxID=3447451 RepID=UPI003F52436C
MRRFALVVALLASGLTGVAHADTVPKIVYVGDSVAAQNAPALSAALGAEFYDASLGGTGICDYLAGEPTWLPASAKLGSLVRDQRPDLVILQFWGNDYYSPCVSPLRRGEQAFYDNSDLTALTSHYGVCDLAGPSSGRVGGRGRGGRVGRTGAGFEDLV